VKATLVAVAGAYSDALAALGATAGKHRCACLGLHPRQKAMRLRPMAAVRLECALGHNTALLISLKNLCLKASLKYNEFWSKRKVLLWFKLGAVRFHNAWCNYGKKEFFAGK
jgi:hypothetical protein